MLRPLAVLIAAFIVGGLFAMPFTASSIAAQEGEEDLGVNCEEDVNPSGDIALRARSTDCPQTDGYTIGDQDQSQVSQDSQVASADDEMVCCDETVQYGGIGFKTRQACRNSSGVVVGNNRCQATDGGGAAADSSDAAASALPAATEEQCEQIITEYMTRVETPDQSGTAYPVMAQIAFNKSRGDSMHYQLGYGPAHSSGGALQIGIDQAIANFEHNPATDEYLEFGDFRIVREDTVISVLYPDGGSYIALADWNTDLPIHDMQCSADRFGAYISGKLRESNGTTLVSIVLNQMSYRDGKLSARQ